MKWVFFVALMYSLPGYAQNKQKDKSKGKEPALATVASADSTKRKGPVSMQDTLKAFQYYPGLFDMYQDTLNGSLLLKLKADQVGKEYIYFSHSADGVLPSGHHRGSFRMNSIFSVQRYYNRIELVLENTGYYFDTLNAVSRSAGANINRPVLASLKILKEDKKTGEILIAADPIFMAETFDPVKDVIPAGQAAGRFYPGKFNKDKSKYNHIRNYPENTDIVVEYVYDNAAPQNGGGKEVTDARSVTIKLQHSLIEVPPAGYTPRRDDPRAGYFMTQVEDMTATDATPLLLASCRRRRATPAGVLISATDVTLATVDAAEVDHATLLPMAPATPPARLSSAAPFWRSTAAEKDDDDPRTLTVKSAEKTASWG
jgi:hypothetical protein